MITRLARWLEILNDKESMWFTCRMASKMERREADDEFTKTAD